MAYTFCVSKKARHVRLAIYSNGEFVVTAPRHVRFSIVENFMTKHAQWISDKLQYFKNQPQSLLTKDSVKHYAEHKNSAKDFVLQRVQYFSQLYDFKYHQIRIKNQKTCWGSCSKKGNLNFNYKIVLLAEEIADYIIVHELCHLKELNHSKKFWSLVGEILPDYRELRRNLKKGNAIPSTN